ncbi:hypothetical protein [Desulfomarina sp.]
MRGSAWVYRGGEKTQLVTAADITFQKGDSINNQFRIIRLLGRGGMGQMYLVEVEDLNKTYALKLILPELVNNPEVRQRFLSEVTISRELPSLPLSGMGTIKWELSKKIEPQNIEQRKMNIKMNKTS